MVTEFERQLVKDIEAGSALFGVDAVMAQYSISQRTACEWRACYADFPVLKMPDGRWVTCRERLEAWREEHLDKFLSRQELKERVRMARKNGQCV